jgi:hypothetical protein
MAFSKRTSRAFVFLGIAVAIVIGYFAWDYLSAGPSVAPITRSVSTELESGALKDRAWTGLRVFVDLPVERGAVGRPDPFTPPAPPANNPVLP